MCEYISTINIIYTESTEYYVLKYISLYIQSVEEKHKLNIPETFNEGFLSDASDDDGKLFQYPVIIDLMNIALATLSMSVTRPKTKEQCSGYVENFANKLIVK